MDDDGEQVLGNSVMDVYLQAIQTGLKYDVLKAVTSVGAKGLQKHLEENDWWILQV